jgi:hypothetical protein
LGVYKVQGTTKEEFVTNTIQVEVYCCHLYTPCHAAKAANATVTYQVKHEIIDNDMV